MESTLRFKTGDYALYFDKKCLIRLTKGEKRSIAKIPILYPTEPVTIEDLALWASKQTRLMFIHPDNDYVISIEETPGSGEFVGLTGAAEIQLEEI